MSGIDESSYKYLFSIATNGMLFVLSLIFLRTSEGIAHLYYISGESFPIEVVTCVLIILNILLILLSTIGLMSYAHNQLQAPYQPLYLLVSLLFITLPLHVSVECVYKAMIVTDGFGRLVVLSMIFLNISFVSMILYISLIFFGIDKIKQKYSLSKYLSMIVFDLAGIILASIIAILPRLAIVMSIIGFVLALIYILFIWALRVTLREPHEQFS